MKERVPLGSPAGRVRLCCKIYLPIYRSHIQEQASAVKMSVPSLIRHEGSLDPCGKVYGPAA